MLLSELITEDCIKIGLEAEDREEVFEELMDILVNINNITSKREEFLSAIRKREEQGTTGIGKGIAIPHSKLNNITTNYGVLGITKESVDYPSSDQKPVHLIFLLITKTTDASEHLNFLKKIALISKNDKLIEQLINAKTPKEVHKLITDFEEQEA